MEDDWHKLHYIVTSKGKCYGPCLQKRELSQIYGWFRNSFVVTVTIKESNPWKWHMCDVPFYNGDNAIDQKLQYDKQLRRLS